MAAVFEVVWHLQHQRWAVVAGGAVVTLSRLRGAARDDATMMAAALWDERGVPAKVRVYTRAGRLTEDREYARDSVSTAD